MAAEAMIGFCENPNCGLHILSLGPDDRVICETVMGPEQTRAMIELCKDFLYDKATERDEDC